jgi:hypothetical protein
MNDDGPSTGVKLTVVNGRISDLQQEHHDLDASIQALELLPLPDQLLIARLKRKKLALKDEMLQLQSRNRPDIIA